MISKSVVAFSIVFISASALAQLPPATTEPAAFDETYRQAVADNPADVVFNVVAVGGRKQFHMGETIPLTLNFSTTAAAKYSIWRPVGRLRDARVTVHIDPADGTADPFAGYRFGPFAGTGRGPTETLSGEAFPMELNEWVRFDKPGNYRLYVESLRLMLNGNVANARGMRGPALPMMSNILYLEILPPDQVWIDAQLASQSRILADSSLSDAQRIGALHVLKNLQTEDAAREILRLFAGAPQNSIVTQEFVPSLYASRYRAIVIEGLQKLNSDPATAPHVSPRLLWWTGAIPAPVQ